MEKFGPNATQHNTTNKGHYSLVVTYFYARNLSLTFSQLSINLFTFFAEHYTYFSTFATVDPTQPTGQPDQWTTLGGLGDGSPPAESRGGAVLGVPQKVKTFYVSASFPQKE